VSVSTHRAAHLVDYCAFPCVQLKLNYQDYLNIVGFLLLCMCVGLRILICVNHSSRFTVYMLGNMF